MTSRRSRIRGLVLTTLAVLTAAAGLAVLSPTPAQAGEAKLDGRLIAAVYDYADSRMQYVEGWSQYGFYRTPGDVAPQSYTLFEINGSPATTTGYSCYWWRNEYNAWFTYKMVDPATGAAIAYVTMSYQGTRQVSRNSGCLGDSNPGLWVWETTTAPPSTWRPTPGAAPPNVTTAPRFYVLKHTPQLFDVSVLPSDYAGHGRQAIVSLGDSTISGEGGRWAGNTNDPSSSRIDAGSTWYWDTPTGETYQDCHRSESAEVFVGLSMFARNFACSGATTYSYDWDYPFKGWRFKPGLDHYCGNSPGSWDCTDSRMGQLNMLYQYAQHHNVKYIVLAIGANDYDFSELVQDCVKLYLDEHLLGDNGQRCGDTARAKTALSSDTQTKIENDIVRSLTDLAALMKQAGYSPDMYQVIIQNYWSPIPEDPFIRIDDNLLDRMTQGGCPLIFGDATWLNQHLLPVINATVFNAAKRFRAQSTAPRVSFLDVSHALDGHRLCENGVGEIEDIPGFTGPGTAPSAADKLEWVTQMRTASAAVGDYTFAEGAHANYWGQLAERACLRQLITWDLAGGRCQPAAGGGVNAWGEPTMRVTPFFW
jgi:hypothetical protein